jgi:hypothetical protein
MDSSTPFVIFVMKVWRWEPQVESVLGSIYVYRVHDYVEQLAVVASLEKFLDEHPRVKLVSIRHCVATPVSALSGLELVKDLTVL